MKKVGIVTIYDMVNYGNRLQNYAVYWCFSKHGVAAETIVSESPQKPHIAIKKFLLSVVHALDLPRYPISDPGYIRWCRFEKFTRKWIPTRIVYSSDKAIPSNLSDQYDMFVTGSDQVWNYEFPGRFRDFALHSKDYFLTFAPPQKRFSISASFGVSQIVPEWNQFYQRELTQFMRISVREQQAVDIVKRLTGKEAALLIDPVMALSPAEWDIIARKPKRIDTEKPYLLTYFLSPQSDENEKKIQQIANMLDCSIYRLWDIADQDLFLSDPSEFLYLIKHARFVCTDSFHAAAFSIVYERPFVTAQRGNMNSRITTLLDTFNLQERTMMKLDMQNPIHIDFKTAKQTLKEKQNEFNLYIEEIVSMV